ncbi:SIS domain-containing protein [Pendulispora albinea]|uniref:SIS domain-containing protein n=1 Tax=Pendulispora albinea TaxID=2741071 RepID=A0ABZ2LK10_9BACT
MNQLKSNPEMGALLSPAESDRQDAGYAHTLREIAQQPITWLETASAMAARSPDLVRLLSEVGIREGAGAGSFFLTGSGSSLYVGQCLAPGYQEKFRVPALAVPAGDVLTHAEASLFSHPGLVLSFARSGDSPESTAAVDRFLRERPRARHLIITCNAEGALATRYRSDPRVTSVVLDNKTNDRSLVMTSSFTNLFLAARVLTSLDDTASYVRHAERLARASADVLSGCGPLANVARRDFRSAIYLGSGARYGAARESALKMLEMTGGHVFTFAETYLGLRHGPMCAVQRDTLLVCFLSTEPIARAYELDLLHELSAKGLGFAKVIVGSQIPEQLVSDDDVMIDIGTPSIDDRDLPAIDVLVGQLLGFFQCRRLGLRPDAPSPDNVIRRVVEGFAVHSPPPSVS